MKRIVEIDDANFEREVLKSSQPVLVEFATDWSLPSVMFDGSMDEIAHEFVEDLKLATVKLDRNPNLGLWYSIRSDSSVFRRWRSQDRDFWDREQGDDPFPIDTGHKQQHQRPSDF